MSVLLYDEQEYTRKACLEVLKIFDIKYIVAKNEIEVSDILQNSSVRRIILIKKSRDFLNGVDIDVVELNAPTSVELLEAVS